MLRLGMRLSVGGGRSAVISALLTALTVALGTAFILVGLSIAPAVQARADRAAWTLVGLPEEQAGAPGTLTISSSVSYIDVSRITVVTVAASDADAPVPPGLAQIPAPGQAYVSPAVSDLLEGTPQADARFGRVVGTIGRQSLRGPEDLLVIRGASVNEAALSGATVSTLPDTGALPNLSGIEKLALALGSLALAAPTALLVSISVQLNATTRQRRRSALNLVGVTSRQVMVITIGEFLAPVVTGAIAGPVVSMPLRRAVARIPFDGASFYASDLTPLTTTTIAVVTTVIVAALLAALAGIRTLGTDGLPGRGPARAQHAPRVRAVGAAMLATLAAALLALSPRAATASAVGAFVCALGALTLIAPMLVQGVGVLLEHLPGVSALLAGRRLRTHPRQVLRPIAGVGVAVLATVMFAAITPAAARSLDRSHEVGQQEGAAQANVPFLSPDAGADLVRNLSSIDGVQSPTAVTTSQVTTPDGAASAWIGRCTDIAAAAHVPGLECGSPPLVVGADVAAQLAPGGKLELYNLSTATVRPLDAIPDGTEITDAHVAASEFSTMPEQTGIDMPDLIIDPALLDIDPRTFRPTLILFSYTSSTALESARTLIESTTPNATVATRETTFDGFSQDARRLYDAISFGAMALGAISACALIVAAAAGLIERRRTYTLLRTAGSRLCTLRTAVVLEGAAPVIVFGLFSALVGIAMGWAVTPGDGYPLAGVVAPVLAILLTAVATLSLSALLVGPLTSTDNTRTE